MQTATINKEIKKYLELLAANQHEKVLEFLKSLVGSTGKKSSMLDSFAGTISATDLADMEKAIISGCEQIDRNEW